MLLLAVTQHQLICIVLLHIKEDVLSAVTPPSHLEDSVCVVSFSTETQDDNMTLAKSVMDHDAQFKMVAYAVDDYQNLLTVPPSKVQTYWLCCCL